MSVRFHALTGIPRSGSSLLCNILRQNPRFHVSQTSDLPGALNVLRAYHSNASETRSALIGAPEKTYTRLTHQYRQFMRAQYQGMLTDAQEVIFDKSRAWTHNAQLLSKLVPEAKVVVVVCDLRRSFASVERQHDKTALLDAAHDPLKRTVLARADEYLSDTGMIGLPARGIEDLLRRKASNVFVLKMEQFLRRPQDRLLDLYSFLDEQPFSHDLENIENTNREVDGLWNYKFPHEGCGQLQTELPSWEPWVPADIAAQIVLRFPVFCQDLGYT